ncbi:hypothetical protein F444_20997, partial [Phytophthora nicotianae P1976]
VASNGATHSLIFCSVVRQKLPKVFRVSAWACLLHRRTVWLPACRSEL